MTVLNEVAVVCGIGVIVSGSLAVIAFLLRLTWWIVTNK
jgi:hypothetical protein